MKKNAKTNYNSTLDNKRKRIAVGNEYKTESIIHALNQGQKRASTSRYHLLVQMLPGDVLHIHHTWMKFYQSCERRRSWYYALKFLQNMERD